MVGPRIHSQQTNFERRSPPCLARAIVTALALAVTLILSITTATADATPGSTRLDDAISAVPPPAPPTLKSIPERSQIPIGSIDSDDVQGLAELREALMPSPSGDRFFDEWPTGLADVSPGEVLDSRDVLYVAAPLVTVPLHSAWQLKFRSTDATGGPTPATATVLVPSGAAAGSEAPILVNNQQIIGLGAKCAPGYTLAHGWQSQTNSADLIPPMLQTALARGQSVIIPDHTGPRMSYAEPTVGGQIVLDSIRAAAAFDPHRFAGGPVALHGYSGGAIATTAAAKLAADYAPEVAERLVGAAVGGVPNDFRGLTEAMDGNLASGVYLSAILGIAREHPRMLLLANNLARHLAISALRDICSGEMGFLGAGMVPTSALAEVDDVHNSPIAAEIYAVTSMTGTRSAVPLYIYHGAHEWWVPVEQARALRDEQCRLDVEVTYREYPGEHMTTLFVGYPEAAGWLDARLRGASTPTDCAR